MESGHGKPFLKPGSKLFIHIQGGGGEDTGEGDSQRERERERDSYYSIFSHPMSHCPS
jgi:hypothetical protein